MSPNPSSRQANEDAAIEWIARLRASDITDAERAEFAAWLAENEAHKQAFDAMAELWDVSGSLEVAAVVPLKPKRRFFAPLAAAASVAMALAMLLVLNGGDVYRTDHGEQRRVVLEDGTTIHLNTNSRIDVAYGQTGRHVDLAVEGEAFFEVASDARRPFTVRTEAGDVQVLGTAFNVRSTPEDTVVTVLEGRVGVAASNEASATLSAAQKAHLDARGVTLANVEKPADIAAWRTGRLVYDGVTLAAMVADLNRYLPRPMALADEHLGDVEVSAVLNLQKQDAMLEALARSLDLRWTTVSDNLILLHDR